MKIFHPLVMLEKLITIIPLLTTFKTTNSANNVPSFVSNNTDLSNATFIKNIGIAPYYYLNNTYPNLEYGFDLEYGDLGDYENNNDTYRNDIIEQRVELGSDFNQLFYMESQDFKTSTAKQSAHISECYVDGIFRPCTQSVLSVSQQYGWPRHTVDLNKWGIFRIYDTSNRDMRQVEKAMHLAITRMEEMFSKKLIHAGHVTALNCAVYIQESYYGESGLYNLKLQNCVINAKLYPQSDNKVLVHEMFHALSNGFLRGKSESMPRMFVEGWADVAGDTGHGNNQDALNKIAILMQNTRIQSLSDLLDALKSNYFDNYVLGDEYFYFCMNTSPITLLRYVNKIKLLPLIEYYVYDSKNLHGIYSLKKECSLSDFEQWLHNPDYTIPDPNLTIEDPNRYYDIILTCDNGANQVLNCKQQPKIHIPKNVSSNSCPIAYDISPFVKDRVIFSHSQGIVVMTNELGDQGFTVLHKVGANIKKYFCVVADSWIYNKIQDFKKSNICTDTVLNKIINFVQQCSSQPLTSEDIGIFPVTTKATTTAPVTTKATTTAPVTTKATTIINTDDANQDIILICDPEQGSSSYICSAPTQQIPIVEQYIKYNCSLAKGSNLYNLSNRVISYYDDIKIITFQNHAIEFITRQFNIFVKYYCDTYGQAWIQGLMEKVINTQNSTCKDILRDIDYIEEGIIKQCRKVSLSTMDMHSSQYFLNSHNIGDTSEEGSTDTWKICSYAVGAFLIGAVVLLAGIGVRKKTQSKNPQSEDPQPGEHELTVLAEEDFIKNFHEQQLKFQKQIHNLERAKLVQHNKHLHNMQTLIKQNEFHKQTIDQNQELQNFITKYNEHATNLTGSYNEFDHFDHIYDNIPS